MPGMQFQNAPDRRTAGEVIEGEKAAAHKLGGGDRYREVGGVGGGGRVCPCVLLLHAALLSEEQLRCSGGWAGGWSGQHRQQR